MYDEIIGTIYGEFKNIKFIEEGFSFLTNEEDIYAVKNEGCVYYESYKYDKESKSWYPVKINHEFVDNHDLWKMTSTEALNFMEYGSVYHKKDILKIKEYQNLDER